MEPLIMMLIIAAVSALFSKNKKTDSNEPAKRQQVPGSSRTQQTAQAPQQKGGQRSFKRIEDYAREMYSEMQAQLEDDPKRAQQARQVKEQAEQVKARASEELEKRTAQPSRQAKEVKQRPGRLSVYQEEVQRPSVQQPAQESLLPLKDEDVLKGIIMAEILLPPKAKR